MSLFSGIRFLIKMARSLNDTLFGKRIYPNPYGYVFSHYRTKYRYFGNNRQFLIRKMPHPLSGMRGLALAKRMDKR